MLQEPKETNNRDFAKTPEKNQRQQFFTGAGNKVAGLYFHTICRKWNGKKTRKRRRHK